MATTYKVVKGDTLWDIVQKPAYKNLIAGNTINAKIKTVAKINNISNPDYIVVGQTLRLSGSSTRSASTTSNAPTITQFGVIANSETGKDREMYAAWEWSKTGTEEYECKWSYYRIIPGTTTTVGPITTTSNTKDKVCFWTAPEEAGTVTFQVRPLDKDGKPLTDCTWSTQQKYSFKDSPPKPSAPEVSIQTDQLWASIFDADGDLGGTIAQFRVYNVSAGKWYASSGNIPIIAGRASWVRSIGGISGQVLTVQCRILESDKDGALASEWSDYSTHIVIRPGSPTIEVLRAVEDDQGNIGVYIEWKTNGSSSSYATLSHEIRYVAKDSSLFDTSDQATSVTVEQGNKWTIYGITIGEIYFFQVRGITTAVGGATGGDASYWSPVESITLGSKPDAPTTWSSSSTVVFGEKINLYWTHNTIDGSSEKSARLRYWIAGEVGEDGRPVVHRIEIPNTASTEEKYKTKVYEFDTNRLVYSEGAVVNWAVSTAGITGEYGPYSENRSFKIFIEPELKLSIEGLVFSIGYEQSVLNRYPIIIEAENATPDNVQRPVSYTIEIKAVTEHETVNYRGETVVVAAGETIFTRHYDISEPLSTRISATDVDLTNNVEYSLICTMAMDSGLVSTSFVDFIASFNEVEYPVGATILLNEERFTATIHPTVEVESELPLADILVAVFRREHDGGFVSIAENMRYDMEPSATDMHPSLDIPRYRIVATNTTTGAISFVDVVGPQFKNKPIVIQWEEDWQNYDYSEEEEPKPASCLKLPYNIDVTDTQEPEVSLVKYIGREHPVAYYGTHLNVGGVWNTVIDTEDQETIYALRRLQRWKGNVYVRAPSGIGYWANIKVSFAEKHLDVSIPVTLTVTRVEGGA